MDQFGSTFYNDDIVNYLIKKRYIRTIDVEKVFRCVNQEFYHENLDYQNSRIHHASQLNLNMPSQFYAIALECLELQKGHKFLNIGSEYGYFNTMAGLLLGLNGINHGIENKQFMIDTANRKLKEFKSKSAAIDHFDFCEPVFIKGNACDLLATSYYDRVYCKAAVPFYNFGCLKSLINVGGILVTPLDGDIVKITRKDEQIYILQRVKESVLGSFDSFESEHFFLHDEPFNTVQFPPVKLPSLQELCRLNIRSSLRKYIKQKIPGLTIRTKCQLESYVGNSIVEKNKYFFVICHNGDNTTISSLHEDLDEDFLNDNDRFDELEEQASNEPSEIKSLKDSIFEQSTSVSEENSVTSNIETTSQNVESVPSTSAYSGSYLWGIKTETNETNASCEEDQARKSIPYQFIDNRQENGLSKLLKTKIDLLPIPNSLKVYLNVN